MSRSAFPRALRDNGLTLAFLGAFLASLVGQAWAGQRELNSELRAEGLHVYSFGEYLLSADFAVDVSENWQSEYLQFFFYIVATVWLVQRGSPESKSVERSGSASADSSSPSRRAPDGGSALNRGPGWPTARGLPRALYSRSLGLLMGGLFLWSWLAQSVAGAAAYDENNLRGHQAPVGWFQYVGSAEFWSRTLQNWQSEFLAVASMAIFSVYLRQRGSPESKPVEAGDEETGTAD